MTESGMVLSAIEVTDVAHAIQLSLAPVFLLNGIGVLLAMLTSRLSRIVDRARVVEQRLPVVGEAEAGELREQLGVMRRRCRLMNRAITLSTFAALLVAAVVALLFAAAFTKYSVGVVIAAIFVVSMLSMVGSLWCFLIEVRIATLALRIGGSRY
jgi:hypothetical protein